MAVMVGVRQDVSIMELPESDHGLAVKVQPLDLSMGIPGSDCSGQAPGIYVQ